MTEVEIKYDTDSEGYLVKPSTTDIGSASNQNVFAKRKKMVKM